MNSGRAPAKVGERLSRVHQRANLAAVLGICGVIPLVNLAAIGLGAAALARAGGEAREAAIRNAAVIGIGGGVLGVIVDTALLMVSLS